MWTFGQLTMANKGGLLTRRRLVTMTVHIKQQDQNSRVDKTLGGNQTVDRQRHPIVHMDS